MGIVTIIFGVLAFLSVVGMIYFSAMYDKLKAEKEFLMKGLEEINKKRLVYRLRKNESDNTERFWRLKYHSAIDDFLGVIFKK